MNMSKKILFIITMIFLSFMISINSVYATTTTTTKFVCSNLDKASCKINRNCKWTGADCIDSYVAADPCSDKNIQITLRFVGYLLFIAKIAIPLIIIVVATFDLFKSVIDKDEKSFGKQLKIVLMRLVAGIFVFFLPTIVYALFNLSAELKIVEDAKYQTCVTCLLKPTQCNITNS